MPSSDHESSFFLFEKIKMKQKKSEWLLSVEKNITML